MFGNRKGWFGFNNKPRNPHSLDQLKYLYNVMSKNQTVSEQNKTLLVETLRSISEILIWGDQNDSSVFDFFLEKNMLSFFLRIMKQKCGSYVCVQLLQTLNILFENIRNETSLYYLLSNNHVNSIIVHKFDFSDEEVMAYYISFLKTLSLKLNTHTIHFFFNEHTNDFPLYTEAIKFFNHSEKMVRIAVRTLTLNVFRVEEPSMLKFITDRTAVPYFSNLVWFIGNHVLEVDNCLHGSQQTQQMVVKLDDLVAEHLDHLHYLNDILLLQIADLNAILTEHLLHRLLIPLYIFSLIEPKSTARSADQTESIDKKIRISRLVSLFLLSQVFLIVSFEPLVRELLNIVQNGNMSLFVNPEFTAPTETLEESLIHVSKTSPSCSRCEDEEMAGSSDVSNMTEEEERSPLLNHQSMVTNESEELKDSQPREPDMRPITDEEKAASANENLVIKWSQRLADRPFLEALFQCLECKQSSDDHTFIFALCLIYAMVHNRGLNRCNLGDLVIVSSTDCSPEQESTCNKLIGHLIQIMHLCCHYNSRIRLVTLEMSVMLLKKLVMRDGKSLLSDHRLASIEQAKEEAASILRNFYKNEEEAIFLDLFEDEFAEMRRRKLNVEYLMMDANLLLPPNQLTSLMMNGIEFTRRLPCADVERTRYAIRVFFLLRDLSLVLRGEEETQLPLTHDEAFVKIDQLLDLNNGDLIACTVVTKDSGKIRRFMVIDVKQLILIEPDNRKLGFGVAKFVALLQDVEVAVDKDDSRSLHLTIRDRTCDTRQKRAVSLAAKFIFDDHIRCMAAKQRLTKGRIKARQRKMHLIAKLIELGTYAYNPRRGVKSQLTTSDMTRSHSQEGFNRKSHLHNQVGVGNHKPLHRTSVPGLAVQDVPKGSKSSSGHVSKRTAAAAARVNGNSLSTISSSRRRSASSIEGDHSRDATPSATAAEKSDEMIALEDMSPKTERRSRCRARIDDLSVSENSETV